MLVEYVCDDHVVTLTLNRPEKLNAFSDELVVALNDALRRFDADPEAYVAILCGSGRAFSSGADVTSRWGAEVLPDRKPSPEPTVVQRLISNDLRPDPQGREHDR